MSQLKKSDFYYELPEELIAQDPLADRASSRLMVLDKKTGAVEHHHFYELPDFLDPGDCLVLNDTKVIPARLYGVKEGTGAAIEVLLLKRLEEKCYEILVKPGKKARPGTVITFGGGILKGTITDILEEGNRKIVFEYEGIFEEILDRLGEMPLPPYIHKKLEDKNRYQTVYAKEEGSAAAPTAGLHFTPELLKKIEDKGVKIVYVTLHVGLGTFRPVKEENILDHHMHSESYQVSRETADTINEVKRRGGRVVCVGTTSVRTLESAARAFRSKGARTPLSVSEPGAPGHGAWADGSMEAGVKAGAAKEGAGDGALTETALEQPGTEIIAACSGDTDIFIYPGYEFLIPDALVTNFHLPESTLVMLVSAMAGRENVLDAYRMAVEEKYRFFSFGDAMLIQ